MQVLLAAGDNGGLAVLDRLHSSYAILLTLLGIAVLAAVLFKVGLIGFVLGVFGAVVRRGVRAGFRVWEVLFSWAPWPVFLGVVLAILVGGWAVVGVAPGATAAAGLAALVMGVSACLAYMFIDLERYEVERGYKAVHDPLKGQILATHLIRHGGQVGVLLLAAAAVGAVGGFALLNQGLYESVGRSWYAVGDEKESAGYADFLSYSLINLYRIVDVLDTAGSRNLFRVTYVRQAAWPAGLMLTLFKTFFTLVLLQQIFASVRQGQALAESIADFWSPHPPIHERARNALPQYGPAVVGPLLQSLRAAAALTKEQRDQLPRVIAGIGPGAIGTLIEYTADEHEGVRAVAAGSLGLLHALDALPALAALTRDASDLVREEAVGALGAVGGLGVRAAGRMGRVAVAGRRRRWGFGRRGSAEAHEPNRVESAVAALRAALSDPVAAVRVAAVRSLGEVGPGAGAAVSDLFARLKDADETVRCAAAEALGRVGDDAAVPLLAAELADPSPAIRVAAVRALGAFREAARPAVKALVPLLQDADDDVRRAAGDAIGGMGQLTNGAARALATGLASTDAQVQAMTAEGIGNIGEAAAAVAPALAAALDSDNDRVRAKAAEALGKIGEGAAPTAVPKLIRALRDSDNWVTALAAEALGEMGDAGGAAVPALVRSLRHANPLVRANAAEALGKMGDAAGAAVGPLRSAASDADGAVRAASLRALGCVAPGRESAAFVAGLKDAEPRVRAAAAEALGKAGTGAADLLPLLDDPSDEVKSEVVAALPRAGGDAPAVVAGLCRRLAEDDSAGIREAAAQALGRFGPAAAEAGPVLLRAARTGEAAVREQALRAIVLIQPPETAEALTVGMADAEAEVRKVASAGWMRAAEIPESSVPALVEALRDPEVPVRSNAAHALARLDELPPDAVPLLAECTADPNDGLRLNAVLALWKGEVGLDVLRARIDDPNTRVRLIAAGAVLAHAAEDAAAVAVVTAALTDPATRMRQVGLDVIAQLGDRGGAFRDVLRNRVEEEPEPALRERAGELLAALESASLPAQVTPTE